MLFNIIAVIIIIIEMDETLVPKAHWAEDTRNLHNWCKEIYYILSYKNKENSPPSNIYLNKLTKLGRCDRYTIEGLIIGLLGLPGLLGVQDC